MLSFISGRASSGKSYEILNRIEQLVKSGENPILLVPEQFSFQTEREVLSRLGDTLSQKVSVLSFTRLCDEMERRVGGICGKTLTDADKLILMNKAIKNCFRELKLWNGYARSLSFARSMVSTVDEFKQHAIYPEDIDEASHKIENHALSLKLHDIALIYSSYNIIIAERFIDPNDRLDKLYNNLSQHKFFSGKTVFIDSFKGFTGQQFKILERIITTARDVVVSMVDDPDDVRKYGILKNVKAAKERIIKIADSHFVQKGEETVFSESRMTSDSMKKLEKLIFSGETPDDKNAEDIIVCRAGTIYDEAEFVARNIRKLVREKGVRFKDIVVIARDTAPYEQPLAFACEKNGVSCFMDKRLSLADMPISNATISAIDAIKSFSTEKILKFLKSGIGILSFEEIAQLENYTYMWNINGEIWDTQWEMSPKGFKKDISEKEKEQLLKINTYRKTVMDKLKKLRSSFVGTPRNLVTALVDFLDSCNMVDSLSLLAARYEEKGQAVYADALRQSWDKWMSLLDSIVTCYADMTVSVAEFTEVLKNSVSYLDIGVIPQNIDEVTFGAADRIRPLRPKYAFIMGANQGVFPKVSNITGILGASERCQLIDLDIKIPDITVDTAIDEDFLVYSNLCCASKGVYITSSCTSSDGVEAQPSAFVSVITGNLNCTELKEPDLLNDTNLPETDEAAFSEFCRRVNNQPDEGEMLQSALKESEVSVRLASATGEGSASEAELKKETALKLFGNRIMMSPTAFESYNGCHFKYFCHYGLGIQKLIPAEFNPAQTGTVVHYVLQRVVEEYGCSISDFSDERISEVTESFTAEYLSGIEGYSSIETPGMKYQVQLIKKSLRYVIKRLAMEFAQSDFEPVCCELKFNDFNGEIPAIKLSTQDGEIVLSGVVDRVDKYNGYVRIVDYKTGERHFKLPDILYGQNMQMILYLYALKNHPQYGGKPAGVFYMPARRKKKSRPGDRRMNGILPYDEELALAMEKENKGEFIPKYSDKKQPESYVMEEDFDKIFEFVNKKLESTADSIFSGKIDANPVDSLDSKACKYCDFAAVCRVGEEKHTKVPSMSREEVMSEIESQVK